MACDDFSQVIENGEFRLRDLEKRLNFALTRERTPDIDSVISELTSTINTINPRIYICR